MKRFWQFLKRFALGGCWVWLTLVLIVSLFRNISRLGGGVTWWWILGGFIGGCLVFSKCRFLPVYVFGHEFTHWVLAKLFRRRTSSFRVRSASGSVRVENPNIWIVLGPYIFPIYVLLGLVVLSIVMLFTSLPDGVRLGLLAAFGCLYAYHIVLTIVALTRNQPDLAFNGPVYSMVFIVFFNVLLLYLSIALLGNLGNSTFQTPIHVMRDQISWLRKVIWWNSLAV